MAGSGGPSPKGRHIKEAKVVEITENTVTFEMETDDVAYFDLEEKYQLIATDQK